MLEVFLKTVPFFGLIGLGYGAGRTHFFPPEATAYLTKFVFYFALSAMLFRFASSLSISEIFDLRLALVYLCATALTYGIAMTVAFLRGLDTPIAAIEAQCAGIGNTGFLGVPMLTVLLGQAAVGPIMLLLSIDLIVFSSALVILVVGGRQGGGMLQILKTVGLGLVKNPMIVAMGLGLTVSAVQVQLPEVLDEFLLLLGAAATPGALFAIGASLASKSAERLEIAVWLSFCKLVLHPGFVFLGAFLIYPTDPYKGLVAVSAAALPVAGNVYILASHYGVAPQRVSASILISTTASIVTVSLVIGWMTQLVGL